ncbi:MAG: ArsR family transcriptional regulator [Candidatus Nanoarchaeia archaeon]
MEEDFTFTSTTFKTLSSDIRVKILKSLQRHSLTQTDLAAHLRLTIPTIKEHLDLLTEEGLIYREEERKWKYYKLTSKGRTLLEPETKFIKLLLGSFTVFTVATAISLYTEVSKYVTPAIPLAKTTMDEVAFMTPTSTATMLFTPYPFEPVWTAVFLILLMVNLLALFFFVIKLRYSKK